MSTAKQQFGVAGERIAARWLKAHGWEIRQERFRSGHRDIDLIAERDGVVAFVEVKARRSLSFGSPAEAVNWRKQRELRRSAQVWIDRHGRPGETYRFDIVGVLLDGRKVLISHLENAFVIA
jgi:putative endonuclease